MVLGISEDFTSNVVLDSSLTSIPESGIYINSGVHSSITLGNLLAFLPKLDFDFDDWNASKTYNVFLKSRNKNDIVSYNDKIYESISIDNLNNNPIDNPESWIETNMDSLRIKIFLEKVKDRMYRDLGLTKRLINNQYIYSVGNIEKTLPSNYAAWVFESKGSDYVDIKINEICLQKNSTDPINIYVINQKTLLDTISLTPDNGKVTFRPVDITFSGKGRFIIAFDSTDVVSSNSTIDPLRFNGFVAYTAIGTGLSPENSNYTYNTYDNGMGVNVTVSLNSNKFIENNLIGLSEYLRATFEYMVFEMFLHNSNNRVNRAQRIQLDDDLLVFELKDQNANTIISRYKKERKKCIEAINNTFDNQLKVDEGVGFKIGSV